MSDLDVAGILRRIRRRADLSQRELAEACRVAPALIAKAETGDRDLPVRLLSRMAALAGLRLALLDTSGAVVEPMSGDTVRDGAGRLMPAHLDTRHGDDAWWGGPHRPRLRNPRYTFDRDRALRDRRRQADMPADHHLPEPGDSLAERAAARLEEARRRQEARREAARRAHIEAGGLFALDWGTGCTCPSECEYAEGSNEDLAHAPECACGCDVA
jgi:transcriptional regulator with XRE-family HTH domain